MVVVKPFPFATVEELKARWPDMPAGSEGHAGTLLEDASQFILDVVPSAAEASEATRRRVVCAVVRRSMAASQAGAGGMESTQFTTGPFNMSSRPVNPHGDFYLTKNEKRALGEGRQKAFSVQVAGPVSTLEHALWCDVMFDRIRSCSCGAALAGEPTYGVAGDPS